MERNAPKNIRLFDVLKEILGKDASIRQFEEYISKIKNIDYNSDYFQISGIGKTRLRRVLKYKLGFLVESELEKEDFDFINGDVQ